MIAFDSHDAANIFKSVKSAYIFKSVKSIIFLDVENSVCDCFHTYLDDKYLLLYDKLIGSSEYAVSELDEGKNGGNLGFSDG